MSAIARKRIDDWSLTDFAEVVMQAARVHRALASNARGLGPVDAQVLLVAASRGLDHAGSDDLERVLDLAASQVRRSIAELRRRGFVETPNARRGVRLTVRPTATGLAAALELSDAIRDRL